MGSVCSRSRHSVRLPSARLFADAATLEKGDGAIFQTDVRIRALAGEVIKLLDVMKDISVTSNTRDVKHALSAAISCSMYIIRFVVDADVYPFQA